MSKNIIFYVCQSPPEPSLRASVEKGALKFTMLFIAGGPAPLQPEETDKILDFFGMVSGGVEG